jgi:hypothetical protein
MLADGEVTYPENDGANNLVKPMPQIVSNAPWTVENTGNPHLISIYSSAFENLQIGDVVAVFNGEQRCTGMVEYDGGRSNLSLVVYGDDPTTETVDGMIENEPMNFVIYRPSTMVVTDVQVNWDVSQPATGSFKNYSMSAITSFKLGSVGIAQLPESRINMYPNPAIENVTISVIGDISSDANVVVYDTRGCKLIEISINENATAVSVNHLVEGMYILRITNNGTTHTEKLIIQK